LTVTGGLDTYVAEPSDKSEYKVVVFLVDSMAPEAPLAPITPV